MGDNYRGYRLVGTTLDLFNKTEFAPDKPGNTKSKDGKPVSESVSTGTKKFELEPGGNWFSEDRREAVVGSFVAQKINLKVGDTFHPFHGLIYNEKDQHAETYVVVGVLKPSNLPADRVIWIPLAGIQHMSGHNPNAATDISAVLVKLKAESAAAGFQMDMMYNKQGNRLTFAWPIGSVMAGLFDKIAWFDRVLTLVAWLVALVAAGSILASIYNSMNERRREFAIMRALGARRIIVFAAIVLEAAAISALGAAVGFIIYGILMTGVAGIIRSQTGVVLYPLAFNWVMVWAPAAFIALGALAGIIPAMKAYRTDVAQNLVPVS